MKPVEVQSRLVDALRLDLVGPENGSDLETEILFQAPSRWYLTGFLLHDPDELSPEILTLRDLHAAMDRAVLDA